MVKRYEPAPHGGVIERDDGKYYHRSDVVDLVRAARYLLNKSDRSDAVINHISEVIGRFNESV